MSVMATNKTLYGININGFIYEEFENESIVYSSTFDLCDSINNFLNKKLILSTGRDWEEILKIYVNKEFKEFKNSIDYDSERLIFSVTSVLKFELLKVILSFIKIDKLKLEKYLIEYNKKRFRNLYQSFINKNTNTFFTSKELMTELGFFESDIKYFIGVNIITQYRMSGKKYFSRKEIEQTLFNSIIE